MISNHHIASLDVDRREMAKTALVSLHQSGLLELVIAQESARLAGGFNSNESEESLAKKILEHRIAAKVLRGLHELGRQFNKE